MVLTIAFLSWSSYLQWIASMDQIIKMYLEKISDHFLSFVSLLYGKQMFYVASFYLMVQNVH